MRNPLRSEAEAFRFLIAVIVGALVIIGAAYVNTWLGVAAAVLAVGGIAWWLKQEPVPGAADPPRRITSETPDGVHRVLVVANETVGGEALLSTTSLAAGDHRLRARYGGDTDFAPSSAETHHHVERATTSTLLTAWVPPAPPLPPS